ncbi:MAG: hypothetical protein PWP37_77 [Thermotogota bacterium]|nr:hypothetical protein [Thermotogota bacterium]MDK2863885.1 hypothetical protein [Thermotogota bacterium]HCZ06520.1 hypothetical protein [Thermotogota bacterium]
MIGFLSDWGHKSYYVGVAKAVIYSLNPNATIVDITHEISPFNVREAMHILLRASQNFPEGSVFLCVVDYGVGTARKSIALRTRNDYFFVGPDNGLFTLVAHHFGVKDIREITNPRFMLKKVSASFHGRDIFAPTAALIDAGEPFEEIGHRLMTYEELKYNEARMVAGRITGEVAYVDGFGNVETNIPGSLLEKAGIELDSSVDLVVNGRTFKAVYCRTFGDVMKGELLVHADSSGYLEVAVNQGNAASLLKVKGGEEVFLEKGK